MSDSASEQAPAKPQGATSQQLAQLFDCTPRQIELWAKDGICVRVGRGRYDAANSTRNLVKHLRAQAAGRVGVDPNNDVVAANRARAEEQAAMYRSRRMKLEGTLVEAGSVADMWGRIFRGWRKAMLDLPSAIVAEVPSLTAFDMKTIKRIVTDMLKDMSDGNGIADGESDAADDVPVSDRAPRGRRAEDAGAAAADFAGGLG